MALRPHAGNVAAHRDRVLSALDADVEAAAGAALRALLRQIIAHLTPAALTAAIDPDAPATVHLFTLGQAAGWWDDAVDRHLQAAVRAVWQAGWTDTSDLPPAAAGAADYLERVKDRLSSTATPTIPEQAFDRARLALADELQQGHGVRETSRRLAAEFGWDQPAEFWRGRLADSDRQLDGILDPLGPPGSKAREAARQSDPIVRGLQDRRSHAVRQVDRVESTWQIRATRIARTETVGAFGAGSQEALVAEGAGVKRWVCVLPDVHVQSVGARHAARRRYVGPTVRIATASGASLALTPEHPVLTGRGWVAADDVQKGDDLYRVQVRDPAGAPHVQDGPSGIGQIVDAAMRSRPGEVRAVPVSMNFHGDSSDSEVEVVPVDGALADELGAGISQDLRDAFLIRADCLAAVLLFRPRRLDDRSDRLGLPSPASSGRGRASGQHGVTLPRRPSLTGGGTVTDRYACVVENPADDVWRTPEVVPDGEEPAAGLVAVDHVAGGDVLASPGGYTKPLSRPSLLGCSRIMREPLLSRITNAEHHATVAQAPSHSFRAGGDGASDVGGGLAGLVSADEVVHVERDWWDGHVYDLSTDGGWYAADGLVVHNSTGDGRTRDTHLAADGQCVPVRERFAVGGAALLTPGDPSGPAEEVISCRCSIVGARDCDEASVRFGAVARVVGAERASRGVPPAE